jgi:hypothetical protein
MKMMTMSTSRGAGRFVASAHDALANRGPVPSPHTSLCNVCNMQIDFGGYFVDGTGGHGSGRSGLR